MNLLFEHVGSRCESHERTATASAEYVYLINSKPATTFHGCKSQTQNCRFLKVLKYFTLNVTQEASVTLTIEAAVMPQCPRHYHTCNQKASVLRMVTGPVHVTLVFHVWACLASLGKRDCQACRNHPFLLSILLTSHISAEQTTVSLRRRFQLCTYQISQV